MLSPFFNLLVQNGGFTADSGIGGEINGTYIGVEENGSTTGSNGTRSYTINGSFASGDTIVILTSNRSSTGNNNLITTATINSESATAAVIHQNASGTRISHGIFYITGISGSSLSVGVSYTGSSVARSVCYAYKLDNPATSVETDTVNGSEGGAQTLSYDVSGETFGVCIFTDGERPVSISTASGWTEDASENILGSAVGSKEDVGTGSVSKIPDEDGEPTGGLLAIFQRSGTGPGTSLGFQDEPSITPSIVGSTSTSGSSSIDLTQITGLQEGDLVVVFVSEDGGFGFSFSITSTGWTTRAKANTNSIQHAVVTKVMGATPDTSFNVNRTLDAFSAIALRDASYDAISSVATGSGSSLTPNSVSVSEDDAITLILAALDDDNSTINTPSTGYTVQTQNGRRGGSNAIMAKTGVSAGTETPGQYVWSSSDAQIAYTLSVVSSGPDTRNSTAFKDIALYLNFIGSQNNGQAGTSTQTFTSVSLGESQAATKRIVVAVGYNTGTTTTITLSTATIAGTSATIVQSTGAAGFERAAIIYADVSGSTISGDIVLNYSGTFTNASGIQGTSIGVYEILNASLISSVTSDTNTRNNSLGAHTTTVATSSGSIVITSVGTGGNSSGTITFANATEDYETSQISNFMASASLVADGASETITATPDSEYGIMVTVAFNP